MKVYIITSGSYSDYGIDRVFLKKEKAKEFIKLYTNCEIEEYETSDDKLDIGKYRVYEYLHIEYTDKNYSNKENFYTCIQQDNNLEYPNLNDYLVVYKSYYHSDNNNICINKLLPDNYTKEDIDKIKEKYLKICRDYISEIKAYVSEGYSYDQIKEMLFK